jgi:riboflavin synthase
MFTGIIEETGEIKKILPIAGGKRIKISASKILDDVSKNDSICVNGVCLTIIKKGDDSFWIEAVGETLEKTTFSNVQAPSPVNLERSLKLNDRIGGHFVQGHVNGIGKISEIVKRGENYLLQVEAPEIIEKYLINEGSIGIDGISLTIASTDENRVNISIIPHTWKNTTLQFKNIGDSVNVEVDVIAKYVEKLITKNEITGNNKITENWLKELGY